MFADVKLRDLLPPSLHDNLLIEPPPDYQMRDCDATLREFYERLQSHFELRACGAAHHFPWVQNQNPENCPWKRTNPGCSHADTSVSGEFRWIQSVVSHLNDRLGQVIISKADLKEVEDFFFNKFVFFPGSPNLSIYFKNRHKYKPNIPSDLDPELEKEVKRVKAFQIAKAEFFFILCKCLSDRVQEILLIPDELAKFSEGKSELNSSEDFVGSRRNCINLRSRCDYFNVPRILRGTDIINVMKRMKLPGHGPESEL